MTKGKRKAMQPLSALFSCFLIFVIFYSLPTWSDEIAKVSDSADDPNSVLGKECHPKTPSSVNTCASQGYKCSPSDMTDFKSPKFAGVDITIIRNALSSSAKLKDLWTKSEDYLKDASYKGQAKSYYDLVQMDCVKSDEDCIRLQDEAIEHFVGWIEDEVIFPLRVIDRGNRVFDELLSLGRKKTNNAQKSKPQSKPRICNGHAQCSSFNCEGMGTSLSSLSCSDICSKYHLQTQEGHYKKALENKWDELVCTEGRKLKDILLFPTNEVGKVAESLSSDEEPRKNCLSLLKAYFAPQLQPLYDNLGVYRHKDIIDWCAVYQSGTSSKQQKDIACEKLSARLTEGKFGLCRQFERTSHACSCVKAGESVASGQTCCRGLNPVDGVCKASIVMPTIPFVDYDIICAKDGNDTSAPCEKGGEFKIVIKDPESDEFSTVKSVVGDVGADKFTFSMLKNYLNNSYYILMAAEWLFSSSDYDGDCVGPHHMKEWDEGWFGNRCRASKNKGLEQEDTIAYSRTMEKIREKIRKNPKLLDRTTSDYQELPKIAASSSASSYSHQAFNEGDSLYYHMHRDLSMPLRDMRFYARYFFQKYVSEYEKDIMVILYALERCQSADAAGSPQSCPELTEEYVKNTHLLEAYRQGYFQVGVGELIAKAEQEKVLLRYENSYLGYTFDQDGMPEISLAKDPKKLVTKEETGDQGYFLRPQLGLSGLLVVDSNRNFEIDDNEIPGFEGTASDDSDKGFRYDEWMVPERWSDYKGDGTSGAKKAMRQDNLLGIFHLNYHRFREIRYSKSYTHGLVGRSCSEDGDSPAMLGRWLPGESSPWRWWYDACDWEWKDKFKCSKGAGISGKVGYRKGQNALAERYHIFGSSWDWGDVWEKFIPDDGAKKELVELLDPYKSLFDTLAKENVWPNSKYVDLPRGNINYFAQWVDSAGKVPVAKYPINRVRGIAEPQFEQYWFSHNCVGTYFLPYLKEEESYQNAWCSYNDASVAQIDPETDEVLKLVSVDKAEGNFAQDLFFLGDGLGGEVESSRKTDNAGADLKRRKLIRGYLNFIVGAMAQHMAKDYSRKLPFSGFLAALSEKLPAISETRKRVYKQIQTAVIELQYYFLQMQRARIGRVRHFEAKARELVDQLNGASDYIEGYQLGLSDAADYKMDNSGNTDYSGEARLNTNSSRGETRRKVKLKGWKPGAFSLGGASKTGDGAISTGGDEYWDALNSANAKQNASIRRYKEMIVKEAKAAASQGAQPDYFRTDLAALSKLPSIQDIDKALATGGNIGSLMSDFNKSADKKATSSRNAQSSSYRGGNLGGSSRGGRNSSYGRSGISSSSSSSDDGASFGHSNLEEEESVQIDNIDEKKYLSDDKTTLWDRITNAYFRNYDRVLSRKRGGKKKTKDASDKGANGKKLMNFLDITD